MNITRHVWRAKGANVRRLARWMRVRGTSRVRIARVCELVCEALLARDGA